MVIFDKKNNNGGQSQGTFHIQGMDIILLLEHFDMTFLSENVAPDFLDYFVGVAKKIKSEKDENNKEYMLREAHQLGIEFSELDNKFKSVIEKLLEEKVLYSKKRLSDISKEELDKKVEQLQSTKTVGAETTPSTEYEFNSLMFGKYVIEQIDCYNEIVDSLYEGTSFNNVYAIRKMRRISEVLTSMGLGVNVEDESNINSIETEKTDERSKKMKF